MDDVAQRQAVQRWSTDASPTVSIVMPVYRTPMKYLQAAVESVRAQTYPRWELCICDDASQDPEISAFLQSLAEEDERVRVTVHSRNRHISAATNSALGLASGGFVGFLDHDDLLTPDALFQVVRVLRDRSAVDFIYSDEDVISADGWPISPHFKPDWNLDLVRSINYVCHFLVLRRELVDACGGLREGYEGAQDFDLVLRASEVIARERIHHIPRVLYHWRAAEGSTADDVSSKPYAADAGVRALADHVARCNIPAEALHSEIPTAYRLRYRQPDPAPSVSIIIPTRNNLRVLRNCVDKLLERTDYPSFEVVVVDNRSDDPATLAYMRDLLALDREALAQSLAGVAASNVEFRWIPSIGQMVMGFILPFALAFVAIPLESFIHASRTVVGLVSASVVRMLAYVAKMSGQMMYQAGRIMIHSYDMAIFLPLSVEQLVRNSKAARETDDVDEIIVKTDETVGGIKP